MPGLSDLFGRNGALEQLLLWAVVNQAVQASTQPALTLLAQDVAARHPVVALDAVTVAQAAARGIMGHGAAQAEAARNGIDAARFGTLTELHTVRLAPADLATAVLRSYMTLAEAEAQAKPQGVDAAMLRILTDLAGDAPGPQDAARALQRGLIPQHGKGATAVSYDQAIAESRLHDKWAPMLRELARQLLSAPDAASAVVRNFLTHAQGQHVAEQQGVDAATFRTMVALSGDAPAPDQLAEALRRGLIPATGDGAASTSFAQGIAEGRLADKWADVIKGLAKRWPTPADALDAVVKGQLTGQQGRAEYTKLGGDLQFYGWLLGSLGEAPTPLEAAAMVARGVIPEHGTGPDVTSYDQAVKESHYRDKWAGAYRGLARYHTAAGEIITFLAHGAITRERATQLLAELDMDAETIAGFLNEAEITALSDYRGVTESSVLDMYYGHLVDRDLAIQILGALHVAPQAADLLLSYVDMRVAIDYVTKAVSRIGTLYVGHKITAQTASQALAQLGVPAAETERILAEWQIEAAANVRTLTESQISQAWYYGILTQDEAITELAALGYTVFDAWVLLSVKAKAPLPGKPPDTAQPPQGAVLPGVT